MATKFPKKKSSRVSRRPPGKKPSRRLSTGGKAPRKMSGKGTYDV